MGALKTTIADHDWVLVNIEGDPKATGNSHYVIVRKVENIDASVARTLFLSINAAGAVTNPVASGVTYSGTFYNARRPQVIEEGDRAVTLVQTLAQETLAAPDFEWEEGSLSGPSGAYVSERMPQRIVTRTVWRNKPTAPGGVPSDQWGYRHYEKNIYGRFTGAGERVELGAIGEPDESKTWIERRSRIDQSATLPTDVGVQGTDYPNSAAYTLLLESFWWRIIDEKIHCKLTYSNHAAQEWVNRDNHDPPNTSILVGSFCEVRSIVRGQWYAERVVERKVSKYFKFSLRLADDYCSSTRTIEDMTEDLNTGATSGSGAGWEVADPDPSGNFSGASGS